MSAISRIQWTQATWNPVLGCSRISPGCKNCYAIKDVHRMSFNPNPKVKAANQGLTVVNGNGPNWTGKVRLIPERLEIPINTKKPTTYFVNSLSDLFHESLEDDAIDRVFATMALTPQHRYQILTKRSERMQEYFAGPGSRQECIMIRAEYESGLDRYPNLIPRWPLPLPNVWLGVSVESRDYLYRIDHLRKTPAAVRFLSLEPLLEDLGDISRYLKPRKATTAVRCKGLPWGEDVPALPGIDWVIVGGESGPGARPLDMQWVRSIVRQCKEAGVPCFVKQMGADPWESGDGDEGPNAGNRLLPKSRKGSDMSEWPEDLRIRQMPELKTGATHA